MTTSLLSSDPLEGGGEVKLGVVNGFEEVVQAIEAVVVSDQ